MPSLLSRVKTAARAFSSAGGYDATEDRGRRRPPRTETSSEDVHAGDRQRKILSGTTRDLARNYVVAGWAIRKHLDYIADFTFQANTGDRKYNEYYEQVQAALATKERFDCAKRHPMRRAIRLAEAGKVVDGRVGWLKLAPPQGNPLRGTIQRIEGDRIFMPPSDIPKGQTKDDWVSGVRIHPFTSAAIAYAICKRVGKTRKELQRIVRADNMLTHEAFEFRNDQVGGVSPITSALNWFQDTYESFDYAFAKLKLGQLFGVAIKTNSPENALPKEAPNRDGDGDAATNDDEEETCTAERIKLTRGPFVTQLDVDEETEIIESKNPSTETVNFLKLVIHIALKALDIPYSFFDESFTNFYGSRGGLQQYLHACNQKVLDLLDLLNAYHLWRMQLAIEDGELELPSGKDLSFLKFEFVPGGVPWWDGAKEARAAAMSVAIGQSSPQRICRETGTNFYRNIDETAEAMDYAAAARNGKGVPLYFGDNTAFAPEIVVNAEPPEANNGT